MFAYLYISVLVVYILSRVLLNIPRSMFFALIFFGITMILCGHMRKPWLIVKAMLLYYVLLCTFIALNSAKNYGNS